MAGESETPKRIRKKRECKPYGRHKWAPSHILETRYCEACNSFWKNVEGKRYFRRLDKVVEDWSPMICPECLEMDKKTLRNQAQMPSHSRLLADYKIMKSNKGEY